MNGQEPSDVLSRLPPDLVDSLNPEQRTALAEALRGPGWETHPINVRLSLPVLGRRGVFLTIVGGAERRSQQRRDYERQVHRLGTIGNLLFIFGVGAVFYLVALISLMLLRRVVEF